MAFLQLLWWHQLSMFNRLISTEISLQLAFDTGAQEDHKERILRLLGRWHISNWHLGRTSSKRQLGWLVRSRSLRSWSWSTIKLPCVSSQTQGTRATVTFSVGQNYGVINKLQHNQYTWYWLICQCAIRYGSYNAMASSCYTTECAPTKWNLWTHL